ncbi:SprT-like domain-containing protein [Mongoliibacter sp.]|uniref:SprT-like domain-containing protein n=1 Tax=Mongoliibacter sp. TaxID=2022438 RepID=UPI0025F1DCB1|nr:SprT-like domain-containing protein [Mongoliibacter sp.]
MGLFLYSAMSNDAGFLKAFQKHLPGSAVDYCFALWKENPFNFLITKERQSKLGDFRFRRDRKIQTISINHNLNQYQFLITYLHELAHFRAFTKYGLRIAPHGIEWKRTFQELMLPMLQKAVFPKDIHLALVKHMANPKASTGADLFLSKVIKAYDAPKENGSSLLVELNPGDQFELKGRKFIKEQLRRTRVICEEVQSGRKYLISAHAEVQKIL